MNTSEYMKQFDKILEGNNTDYPYNSDAYINYVKMNQARINRWTKKGKILEVLEERILAIDTEMHWLLITEPWCGDAAHSHAFISKLAELNPKIHLDVQNRDAEGSEIINYLTNGTQSIPILVVRDAEQKDLFVWGPRPSDAQKLYIQQRSDDTISPDDKKRNLQVWYNKDKGVMMQQELNTLFANHL